MLPKPPPRDNQLGFLYLPPIRVQGTSVAGESTAVQIPEMDVCFDMGVCPRAMLSSRFCAISHGHMDHVGALAYWCSQRRFQGMGTGKIVCDARIAPAIHGMMAGFVELERQKTLYEVVALEAEETLTIKNNIIMRAFHTEHTAPSAGYTLLEKRTKLRPEYHDLPQEKLKELKERGVEITRSFEIPLACYVGDTAPGAHLVREDVRKARVIICECTFFEPDHKDRAKVGMHLHVDDIAEWLGVLECEHLVLIHLSRRTEMSYARRRLVEVVGEERAAKVLFLMDHRANRARYERQVGEAPPQPPTPPTHPTHPNPPQPTPTPEPPQTGEPRPAHRAQEHRRAERPLGPARSAEEGGAGDAADEARE